MTGNQISTVWDHSLSGILSRQRQHFRTVPLIWSTRPLLLNKSHTIQKQWDLVRHDSYQEHRLPFSASPAAVGPSGPCTRCQSPCCSTCTLWCCHAAFSDCSRCYEGRKKGAPRHPRKGPLLSTKTRVIACLVLYAVSPFQAYNDGTKPSI